MLKVGLLNRPEYQRDVLTRHPILKDQYDADKAGVILVFHHSNDKTYYTGDGLQRVSKAKEDFGTDYEVPCYVYTDFSPAEEIDLFVSWNYDRKNVSALKIFLLKAQNGDHDSEDIVRIIKESGFTIAEGNNGPLNFRGAGAVQNVYGWHRQVTRPEALRQTLKIMKGAYGDSGDATYGGLVRGVGYLVSKYTVNPSKVSKYLAETGSATTVMNQIKGITSGGQEAKVGEYLYSQLSTL
jgi:hypothetical protein